MWRIKYRDAGGTHVEETLGPEPIWNEKRAERELGKRLDAVERGLRKRSGERSTTSPISSTP